MRFKSVLSEGEAATTAEEIGFFDGSDELFLLFAHKLEQAVLAKLHEQQPAMYARTYNGEIDWDEACVTEANDGALLCDLSDLDDDGNVVVPDGYDVIPLYAHPAPALEPDYYFYKGKLHCNDGGTHLNHGAKEHGRPLYAHPMPSKPYSIDKDEAGIRELVASAITGTIHAGLEGGETPPIGHWLSEFYDYGAAYEHIQQAVLAKLVEQEPVATLKVDSVSGIDVTYHQFKGLYDGMKLYAHPMPETKEHHRTTKNHIPDTGKMVFDPDAALTLAERTLSIDITESIAGEIIQFSRKPHEKYAQADHIADASKMVPDGWQLVPKQATNDMYLSFCHVRNDIEPDEFREAYRAALEAAPKYEKNNE